MAAGASRTDLARLPEPVALVVVEFLDGVDLARCERVSARWRRLARTKGLWHQALARGFPQAPPLAPNANAKEAYAMLHAQEKERLRRVREEEAEREARREMERRRSKCVPLKRTLQLLASLACNACYAPPFILQSVLLPLKLDGHLGATWAQVLSPMVAFALLCMLQIVAIVVNDRVWTYLFDDIEDGNVMRFVAEDLFAGASRWHALLFAGSGLWMLLVVLAAAKLDGTEFVDGQAAAVSTPDIKWVGLAFLLLLVLAVVIVGLFGLKRAFEDDGMGTLPGQAAALFAVPCTLCLWIAVLLAAINGDDLVAGREPSVQWSSVFVPLWIGTALLGCSPCCALLKVDVGDWCDENNALRHCLFTCLMVFALSPFLVFEAMLSAKLDGELDVSNVVVFISLFVSSGLALLGTCIFTLVLACGDDD